MIWKCCQCAISETSTHNRFKIGTKDIGLPYRVENMVGKRGNAGVQHSLCFPERFLSCQSKTF